MTVVSFIAYSGALAVAAAIPGPGIAALVAAALGSGFRSALFMAFGLVLGDLVYLTAAVLGLAYIAQMFGTVFLLIKWAGISYLIWLAWNLWTADLTQEHVGAGDRKATPGMSFLSGFTITLGNPKTMIFYLALTPTLVDLQALTLADYIVLTVLTIIVLLVVLVPYLALAARARGLLASPRALKRLKRVAASFLGGAALMIATR